MNSTLMTALYTICWLLILFMLFFILSSLLQYKGMEHKSTKAQIGLITMLALCLVAVIGLVLAQTYSIDLVKKGVLFLLLFDYMVIQSLNQWTIANVQKRISRIIRWVITILITIYGLVTISFFIFVRS